VVVAGPSPTRCRHVVTTYVRGQRGRVRVAARGPREAPRPSPRSGSPPVQKRQGRAFWPPRRRRRRARASDGLWWAGGVGRGDVAETPSLRHRRRCRPDALVSSLTRGLELTSTRRSARRPRSGLARHVTHPDASQKRRSRPPDASIECSTPRASTSGVTAAVSGRRRPTHPRYKNVGHAPAAPTAGDDVPVCSTGVASPPPTPSPSPTAPDADLVAGRHLCFGSLSGGGDAG
jgi:hypothetical protein